MTDPVACRPRFYDQDFGFRSKLENGWRLVLDEWNALPRSLVREWPQRGGYTGRWEVFGLYGAGVKFRGNCRLMPRTTELVEQVPGLVQAGFSVIGPHTLLPEHNGPQPAVLRCHLGLYVPRESGLRVMDEVRHYEPGRTMVFDDNLQHEAWNHGDSEKVSLMIDFLKPPELMKGLGLEPNLEEPAQTMAGIVAYFGDWLHAE